MKGTVEMTEGGLRVELDNAALARVLEWLRRIPVVPFRAFGVDLQPPKAGKGARRGKAKTARA